MKARSGGGTPVRAFPKTRAASAPPPSNPEAADIVAIDNSSRRLISMRFMDCPLIDAGKSH
jgi:hypothetical protein